MNIVDSYHDQLLTVNFWFSDYEHDVRDYFKFVQSHEILDDQHNLDNFLPEVLNRRVRRTGDVVSETKVSPLSKLYKLSKIE
mmetsp:Transcript_7027/g.10513  ORF Transcript_7027/g.10513 Transcript_7027/m.10513 type:complete len:82 (-) Transcript_7027:80-325(-)